MEHDEYDGKYYHWFPNLEHDGKYYHDRNGLLNGFSNCKYYHDRTSGNTMILSWWDNIYIYNWCEKSWWEILSW